MIIKALQKKQITNMRKLCNHTILRVLTLLTAVMLCSNANAQSRDEDVMKEDSVRVFFKQGYSKLELDFRNNEQNLEAFIARMNRIYVERNYIVRKINVVSSVSPEGGTVLNRRLSDNRAKAIMNYLQNYMVIPDSLLTVTSIGEDWDGLYNLVKDSDIPHREEALNIIRNTPIWIFKNGVIVDGRKRQLKMLHGGESWRAMFKDIFPVLRSSALKICVEMERVKHGSVLDEKLVLPAQVGMPAQVRKKQEMPVEEETCKPFYMDIRTNLLYDAALVPNIGVEFYLGRRWSIAGNWMYAWWHSDKRHNYWRVYGGDLELRKWFGRRSKEKPLTGHHLGLYGQIVTYDFELGARGYLGDRWSYGAGISYGYSVPIARRLNLDFTIGVGYLGGEYKEYLPIDDCYVWQVTKNRHWFGPTKAEIQLIWLIGCGNYNKKWGDK